MKFPLKSICTLLMMAGASLLLGSCGGGSQIEAFVPARIIAFGDENSLIEPGADGKKYTINAVKFDATTGTPLSPTQFDCTLNQNWAQQVASSYAITFGTLCPIAGYLPKGLMRAAVGATAATLTTQIDTFISVDGPFGTKDLVTVMVGVQDIVNAYQGTTDQAARLAAVDAAGTTVGAQVVRLTELGAKVLVSTIPDVGFMPYAVSKGGTAQVQLSELTTRFNTRLRLKLNDVRDGGRSAGLVTADQIIELSIREPASYLLTNIIDGACVTALPNCNQADPNLVPGAAGAVNGYGSVYLWADELHMSASTQARVGTIAVIRAHNNPF